MAKTEISQHFIDDAHLMGQIIDAGYILRNGKYNETRNAWTYDIEGPDVPADAKTVNIMLHESGRVYCLPAQELPVINLEHIRQTLPAHGIVRLLFKTEAPVIHCYLNPCVPETEFARIIEKQVQIIPDKLRNGIFVEAPGLSWAIMLNRAPVEFEGLQDADLKAFIQSIPFK